MITSPRTARSVSKFWLLAKANPADASAVESFSCLLLTRIGWLLSFGIFVTSLLLRSTVGAEEPQPLRVLIIDGQNNHNWQVTTPLILKILEATGRFHVDVATSPAKGEDLSGFRPAFEDYDVVLSNYNGELWSEETQGAFEQYVAGGGGFVSFHAANNAFPQWTAYNRMIGLGGWGGRDADSGPYVRFESGRFIRDSSPGRGGSHGRRHPFLVVVRDAEHPVTEGVPSSWMQANDELYAELRGPAENMHVLATAYSDPATGGTGKHEPILMTTHYGQGRVFHTTLGHDAEALHGVACQVTLQRGTEWAATGKVTLPSVDAFVLTRDQPALRDPANLQSTLVNFDQPPDPSADGWVSLFTGDDLSGWVQRNGTATFRVADGTIIGKTATGSPNSFLCTTADYADFELTFEVWCDTELNSGVQIRSRSTPEFKNGRVHGPQVEIEGAPGESGYIYSEATGRGWISKEQPIKDAIVNDQWNRYLVRAVGDRIQTWVNGRKIEDLRDPESFSSGFIGLQVHGIKKNRGPYEVRWRDLQIRPL